MESSVFAEVVAWVLAHGYPLMFLAMLVEGPLLTSAASFAAALGYFDIRVVLALSFFGDLASDLIYYAIGYVGRLGVVERYGRLLGITHARLEKVEAHFRAHAVKELIILKFVPALPVVGLITAGALRMPFQKFILTVTLVIIPRTLLFAGIGFYFGHVYDAIARTVNNVLYSLLILAAGGVIAYALYRKIGRRISAKVEKIGPG